MPLIKELHNDDGTHILIYHGSESLDFFIERTRLSPQDKKNLEKYTVERRKKDLVIARYLLQHCYPKAEVVYHPSGKPYLKNGEAEISISHSKDLVAVILHKDKTVGIDIEYITPRLERLKQRYLSAQEIADANTTTLLTLYWSAKETLFKLDEAQGLEFNTDLKLSPTKGRNILIGKIKDGNDISVHYSIHNEWVMTYALS